MPGAVASAVNGAVVQGVATLSSGIRMGLFSGWYLGVAEASWAHARLALASMSPQTMKVRRNIPVDATQSGDRPGSRPACGH